MIQTANIVAPAHSLIQCSYKMSVDSYICSIRLAVQLISSKEKPASSDVFYIRAHNLIIFNSIVIAIEFLHGYILIFLLFTDCKHLVSIWLDHCMCSLKY